MRAVIPGRVVLIAGGVRSGKSAFALTRARQLGQRRAFVATAQPFDQEMRTRIARHAAERGGDFDTVEEPVDLVRALSNLVGTDVVVVDCLTLWLSNLLLAGHAEGQILERVDELISVLTRRDRHALVVSNEVGMGVVPESSLGRSFRDLSGLSNQRLARVADEHYAGIAGSILRLRPGPIALIDPQEEGNA